MTSSDAFGSLLHLTPESISGSLAYLGLRVPPDNQPDWLRIYGIADVESAHLLSTDHGLALLIHTNAIVMCHETADAKARTQRQSDCILGALAARVSIRHGVPALAAAPTWAGKPVMSLLRQQAYDRTAPLKAQGIGPKTPGALSWFFRTMHMSHLDSEPSLRDALDEAITTMHPGFKEARDAFLLGGALVTTFARLTLLEQ